MHFLEHIFKRSHFKLIYDVVQPKHKVQYFRSCMKYAVKVEAQSTHKNVHCIFSLLDNIMLNAHNSIQSICFYSILLVWWSFVQRCKTRFSNLRILAELHTIYSKEKKRKKKQSAWTLRQTFTWKVICKISFFCRFVAGKKNIPMPLSLTISNGRQFYTQLR